MDSPMVWDEHSQNTIIINEVKKYEHLYDLRRPDYKDASKKERTWAAIAAVIDADPSAVKKRWKNLRDTYARKMKEAKRLRRLGAIPTRQERWPYYGMLSFLQDVVKTRVTYCSVMNKSNSYESELKHEFRCEGSDEQQEKADLDEIQSSIQPNSTFDSGLTETHEHISTPMMNSVNYSMHEPLSNKSDSFVCSTTEAAVTHPHQDTAESFGRYVAAEMRDLLRHQQQWARFKISEILYQASAIQPTGPQISHVTNPRHYPDSAFVLKQPIDD